MATKQNKAAIEPPASIEDEDNQDTGPHLGPRTKKSVSFSNLAASREHPKMSSATDSDHPHDATSDADERTAMLISRKDKGKDYASIPGSSASTAKSSGVVTPDSAATVTKRRKGSQANRPDDEDKSIAAGFWGRLLDKYGSVELENKGSVARDHLALERTFLAWLRTSLSFASIGIAVTQLFRLNTSIGNISPDHPAISHLQKVGKPLGATFIAIAIVILFVGFHRYFESQHYVIRGKFPASRGSIFLVALLAFTLSSASLIVVLSVGGHSLGSNSTLR